MKKLIGFIFILGVLIGCNSDTKNAESEGITNEKVIEKPAQIADVPWAAVVDSVTQKIKMTQSTDVATKDLDSNNVTEVLNRKYPEIKVVWQKQQHDTAFVSIPNATYLTQSSGSMGADIYMSEVTYSYSQIPGINFVNFSFKEGDHAAPGTFKRSNFSFKN